jgi:hypothetical protein
LTFGHPQGNAHSKAEQRCRGQHGERAGSSRRAKVGAHPLALQLHQSIDNRIF